MATIINKTTTVLADSTMSAIQEAMHNIGKEECCIYRYSMGGDDTLLQAYDEIGFLLFTIDTESDEIY